MGDLILKVTGNRFKEAHNTTYLVGNDITVDWGDGNVESLGTKLDHSYSDGLTEHIITISNVTGLGDTCFGGCTNLISVIIPSTLTSIDSYCFENCTGLKTMVFLGSSAPYAGYKSFDKVPSSCVICVPNAQSTSIYSEEENYPNPNTYHYTLNNILSLNGSLSELGYIMANNLSNMGISNVHGSDGLTSLANQILNIEPSVSGLNLETSLTIQSEAEIEVGESVVISSKLNVFYDDETLVNVDLSGVLTGATINIKEGNNIVGTGITNSNGIADISISNLSLGTHNLKAVFTGTENFQECESNTISVDVIILTPTSIDINATKNILSYVDADSTDITVTLVDENNTPVKGRAVTIGVYEINSNNLIESLSVVDENNGTYTSTYNSQGVGDVYIKAEYDNLVTENIPIQDMFKYDDATTDKSNKFSFISNPVNASISHQTDHYVVNYSRTPESNPVKINLAEFICDSDFEASIDVIYNTNSSRQWTWKISGNSNFDYNNMSEIGSWSGSRILRTFSDTTYSTNPSGALPVSTWMTLKFKKQNGNILLQVYNDSSLLNQLSSTAWTVSTKIIMGLQMSETITSIYFKNLKIKKL